MTIFCSGWLLESILIVGFCFWSWYLCALVWCATWILRIFSCILFCLRDFENKWRILIIYQCSRCVLFRKLGNCFDRSFESFLICRLPEEPPPYHRCILLLSCCYVAPNRIEWIEWINQSINYQLSIMQSIASELQVEFKLWYRWYLVPGTWYIRWYLVFLLLIPIPLYYGAYRGLSFISTAMLSQYLRLLPADQTDCSNICSQ